MNLTERIEYLLKQQGETLEQKGTAPQLLEALQRSESNQEATQEQLLQLARQFDCPVDYLAGNQPFEDVMSLEENKGNISIHLKLMLAIQRKKQDILYGIKFRDYLHLVEQYIATISKTDSGIDVYYK